MVNLLNPANIVVGYQYRVHDRGDGHREMYLYEASDFSCAYVDIVKGESYIATGISYNAYNGTREGLATGIAYSTSTSVSEVSFNTSSINTNYNNTDKVTNRLYLSWRHAAYPSNTFMVVQGSTLPSSFIAYKPQKTKYSTFALGRLDTASDISSPATTTVRAVFDSFTITEPRIIFANKIALSGDFGVTISEASSFPMTYQLYSQITGGSLTLIGSLDADVGTLITDTSATYRIEFRCPDYSGSSSVPKFQNIIANSTVAGNLTFTSELAFSKIVLNDRVLMNAIPATAASSDITSPKTAMLSNGIMTTGTGTGGATPTGTKNISISSNGTTTEDVTNYASASITVSVPNSYTSSDEGKVVSNGALVAQTSSSTTTNGTIDTTLINSLSVNVPTSGSGSVEYGTFTVASNISLPDAGATVTVGFTGDPDYIYCWMDYDTFADIDSPVNNRLYRWIIAKKGTATATFPPIRIAADTDAQTKYADCDYVCAQIANVNASSDASNPNGYAVATFNYNTRNPSVIRINSNGSVTLARNNTGSNYLLAGTYHYYAVTGGMNVYPL